ncbi:V-type ATP synthase subunit I [Acidaminobacter sp.]|uniref:V-type ATP synthase subunit I n=1 Tax=Acidaminobacter sp. TaxID=1872102 RepID=UPI00256A04B7|nr:V-type ATP synthase subunit I [Acidaminobacter sp.]MDK9710362.1 V-type ATP synthase subunit I [Acidaminobacter sp.]
MAIVPMKKVTVAALQSELQALMSALQQFSGIEVTKLEPQVLESLQNLDPSSLKHGYEESLRQLRFCMQHLEPYEAAKGKLRMLKEGRPILKQSHYYDRCQDKWWIPLYNTIKKWDDEDRKLQSQKTALEAEVSALQPVKGIEFSGEMLSSFHYAAAELGILHKDQLGMLESFMAQTLPEAHFEKLGIEKDGILVLLLTHTKDEVALQTFLHTLRYSRVQLEFETAPTQKIPEIREALIQLDQLRGNLAAQIEQHAGALEELRAASDMITSEIKKCDATALLGSTRSAFLLEGWVPVPLFSDFEKIVMDTCGGAAALTSRDPNEEDHVPVLLKNNAFAEAFEPVTAMYSLPSYFETDPTPVYAPFMLVFFGMMLSDAAYGIVMSSLSLWALKALNLDLKQRKFAKLFLWLGLSTAFFGVLYGSYFGDLFSAQITPVWLDPSSNPMSVLYVAIGMGVIHIYVGLGIKAWNLIRNGKIMDAVYDSGLWVVTLSGIIMMLLGIETIGKIIAILGAVGLVLTQGRDKKGIVPRLASGLFGLYGITGYLGDVLSYSRLLALGLATGLIGSAFNLMVRLIGFGPLTFVFAVLIFLGGHTFNLLINILGAYVHAVRLQYLEFFGKFYTGGGRAFAPFATESKYCQFVK